MTDRPDWLVKVYRYDGSESIIASYSSYEDADADAQQRNRDEQTTNYYAQKRMSVEDAVGIWSADMLDGIDSVECVRRMRDEGWA